MPKLSKNSKSPLRPRPVRPKYVVLLSILTLFSLSSIGQNASLKGSEAAKKEQQLKQLPGYYNQEQSLDQWAKWNKQSPEAIARARKLVNESMPKPGSDPGIRTYKSYEEFRRASKARLGWDLPNEAEYQRQKAEKYTNDNKLKETRDGRKVKGGQNG